MPELERSRQFLHIGEFVLSLLGAASPNIGHPTAGAFVFYSESGPLITRFLSTGRDSLTALFGDRLREVLTNFDTHGSKLAMSGNCWGDGFQRGAVKAVFGEEKVS